MSCLTLCIGLLFLAASAPTGPSATLEMQVRLDRASFSPGEIDGTTGPNFTRALDAYRRAHHLGAGIAGVRAALIKDDPADPLVDYTITTEDAAGPFLDHIPTEPAEQAALPSLSYTSLIEMLGERTHASPALLKRLNPRASFTAGETIRVPNVATGATSPRGAADRVVVARAASGLTVYDKAGHIVFFAPVTSGSEHDPLPLGNWTVKGVSHNPSFHYNPALFWDAEPGDSKTTIPPGPNGPVGTVWIDLSKPHYGIHGTAEPGQVGHTASHGCVRLTNWDAEIVAAMVRTGTRVVFER
jgi:lipoprotein-anchoring transpeptidase ErfK/SrfK